MTQKFKEVLINEGLRSSDSFKGCSDEEIQQVIKAQNIKKLPSTFVEYLSSMGHSGITELFVGEDNTFSSMLNLKRNLIDQLQILEIDFILPKDAFVFWGHHDVEYKYFLTGDDNNDPPVYVYLVEDGDAQLLTNSFTEYLNRILLVYRRLS